MIVVIARLRVRPGSLAEFQQAYEAVRAASLQEEGAVSYRAQRGLVDDGELVFIEEWADRGTLDRHFTQPHFAAFDEVLQPLLVEPPEVHVHEIAHTQRL